MISDWQSKQSLSATVIPSVGIFNLNILVSVSICDVCQINRQRSPCAHSFATYCGPFSLLIDQTSMQLLLGPRILDMDWMLLSQHALHGSGMTLHNLFSMISVQGRLYDISSENNMILAHGGARFFEKFIMKRSMVTLQSRIYYIKREGRMQVCLWVRPGCIHLSSVCPREAWWTRRAWWARSRWRWETETGRRTNMVLYIHTTLPTQQSM